MSYTVTAPAAKQRTIRARVLRGFLPTALAALMLGGCATTAALQNGRAAERRKDYDRAVAEYTRAVRLNPDDTNAREALRRSKLRAATEHYVRGRRLAEVGNYDQAVLDLEIAAELNPASGDIQEALRETRVALRHRITVDRQGKTELESLVEQASQLPPPGLDLLAGLEVPDSLAFRDAGSRDVFTALARFAGVNVVFDPAFQNSAISVDLQDATFADALTSVAASTGNFYRLTAPRTITIIPDTPAKRREYEEEIVQTFYLSNADLKETIDLLRIVIDARRVAPINATNALTIKDTPERIAAAARVLRAIDKARPEVIIDVELLEVDRTRLLEYGLQVASPGEDGISGQVDVNQEGLTLEDLSTLSRSEVFVFNVPGLFYRLLKNDASSRTLANPHLRTSEGLPAQARFGERVPVPVTIFSPIATGGIAQQPITSFNYENIGVNIDITPRTHHDDDVSLETIVEISTLSGIGFGGLPTFGNRSISTTIRLRDGETTLLAGLIRDDERQVLAGIPGLSDLPLVGRLFAFNRTESQETDIILTLTPHIVRVLDLTEEDLRPFRVGGEGGGSQAAELPTFSPPPVGRQPAEPQPQAPPPEVTEPEPTPGQPGPIRPPRPPEPH